MNIDMGGSEYIHSSSNVHTYIRISIYAPYIMSILVWRLHCQDYLLLWLLVWLDLSACACGHGKWNVGLELLDDQGSPCIWDIDEVEIFDPHVAVDYLPERLIASRLTP